MAIDWARIRECTEARLLAIAEELGDMGPNKAGGLPDYKGSGGAEHQAYKKGLLDEQDRLQRYLGKIPAANGQTGTSVRIIPI